MHDLYVCAVYIPPVTSVHYDNIFANQGKVLLIGDFNSRTGQSPDYILKDSTDLNCYVTFYYQFNLRMIRKKIKILSGEK
jgi:hypothetical protein